MRIYSHLQSCRKTPSLHRSVSGLLQELERRLQELKGPLQERRRQELSRQLPEKKPSVWKRPELPVLPVQELSRQSLPEVLQVLS